jgi:hypothetical protein
MSDTITYCANGCRTNGHPTQTTAPDRICRSCDNRLHGWLADIPDNYALLPRFLEHGTTERNPESVATKRAFAPAPMRLEIIDLLDTRLGRIWNGTAPASDRRGTIGTLQAHVEHLATDRNLTNIPYPLTVVGACKLLQRHRIWLIRQDWIEDLYAELKTLHRQLSDAVGDYRRPPVGHCHVEHNAGTCGGLLFANTYGGVRCAKCGAVWDADHLRLLGIAQAESEQESA